MTRIRARLAGLLLAGLLTGSACAQQGAGIPGKNGWLFYRLDLTDASEQPAVDSTLDLVARLSRMLEDNGTRLAVAIVPVKMRIHAEHLPTPLPPFLEGHYARSLKTLRQQGVRAVDLDTVFRGSPLRDGDTPPFLRQDSHWSPTGAHLAASAIGTAIAADPALSEALAASPERDWRLVWEPQPVVFPPGDLSLLLPPGTPKPEPERVRVFRVSRPDGGTLLGEPPPGGVMLLGSSYSGEWTGFPGALRAVLRRDVPALSTPADRGQWIGLDSALRDEAFQKHRPRLLIWEIPERSLAAPPSYRWRDPRYVMDDRDWLAQAGAWIDTRCAPPRTGGRFEASGLLAGQTPEDTVRVAASTAADFIDIALEPAADPGDYLALTVSGKGTTQITIDALGPGTPARRSRFPFVGDGEARPLRVALRPDGQKITRLRLYPGKTRGFTLSGLRFCRLPGAAH